MEPDLDIGIAGLHVDLDRWFYQATELDRQITAMLKRLSDVEKPRKEQLVVTPEHWLYGKRLPNLYKSFTNEDFGISKVGDKVQRTTGVAFVLDCAKAIGLDAGTPENVAQHWKSGRRKQTG